MSSKEGKTVGLVVVDIGDTSVQCALLTCKSAGLSQVIIVDPHRMPEVYASSKQKFQHLWAVRTMGEAQRQLAKQECKNAEEVLDVPPMFLCRAASLVETLRDERPEWARQCAAAPCYSTPLHHTGWATMTLMTHLVWMLFSWFNWGRTYRGTSFGRVVCVGALHVHDPFSTPSLAPAKGHTLCCAAFDAKRARPSLPMTRNAPGARTRLP